MSQNWKTTAKKRYVQWFLQVFSRLLFGFSRVLSFFSSRIDIVISRKWFYKKNSRILLIFHGDFLIFFHWHFSFSRRWIQKISRKGVKFWHKKKHLTYIVLTGKRYLQSNNFLHVQVLFFLNIIRLQIYCLGSFLGACVSEFVPLMYMGVESKVK